MDIDINIDRRLKTPIYRQIIEQITTMVQKGILKSGDRLPPERELADGNSNRARYDHESL